MKKIMDLLMEELNKNRPEDEKIERLHSEKLIIDSQNRSHKLNGQYAPKSKEQK